MNICLIYLVRFLTWRPMNKNEVSFVYDYFKNNTIKSPTNVSQLCSTYPFALICHTLPNEDTAEQQEKPWGNPGVGTLGWEPVRLHVACSVYKHFYIINQWGIYSESFFVLDFWCLAISILNIKGIIWSQKYCSDIEFPFLCFKQGHWHLIECRSSWEG